MEGEQARKSFEGIYLEEFLDKLMKRLSEAFDTVILNGYIQFATRYRFSNTKLDLVKNLFTDFVEIFVAKDDKYVSQRVSNISTRDVDEVVEEVKDVFGIAVPAEDKYSPPESSGEFYEIIPGTFSDKVFDENLHSNFVESILSFEGRNVKRLSGIFSAVAEKHFILTSYGVKGESKTSDLLVRVRGFKDKEISYTDVKVGVELSEKDVENLLNNIDSMLGYVEYVSTVDEGVYNVLFSPQSYANLINYLGYMLSGYSYTRNMSALSGLLGEEIASKDVYIYDDPRMKGSLNATPFDEEGVKTSKTEYFKDGVFNDLALNTLTAVKLGRESNGHAGIITPHTYPLIFEVKDPLDSDPESIFKELDEGIYISNVWYTRFANFRLGTMSTLQRDIGLYIDDGKVKGAFSGARLSLTIKDLISKVMFASKADEWVQPWDVWNPSKVGYVALKDVEVTTGF